MVTTTVLVKNFKTSSFRNNINWFLELFYIRFILPRVNNFDQNSTKMTISWHVIPESTKNSFVYFSANLSRPFVPYKQPKCIIAKH